METYIKNKGISQTVFQDNHHNQHKNEIKWNAKYDGKLANISLNMNDNGKKNKYRVQLNNEDLANLLSIPVVNKPLDSRLREDFMSDLNFLDDEDIELLNNQVQECYEPSDSLFRVSVPQLNTKKEEESQGPVSCPLITEPTLKEKEYSNPEKETKPHTISIDRPKLTKNEKKARLKTPSPKTLRIHYTSGRGTRSKKHAKKHQNKTQNNFVKFFNKLF
jgi:hypothetical protein